MNKTEDDEFDAEPITQEEMDKINGQYLKSYSKSKHDKVICVSYYQCKNPDQTGQMMILKCILEAPNHSLIYCEVRLCVEPVYDEMQAYLMSNKYDLLCLVDFIAVNIFNKPTVIWSYLPYLTLVQRGDNFQVGDHSDNKMTTNGGHY